MDKTTIEFSQLELKFLHELLNKLSVPLAQADKTETLLALGVLDKITKVYVPDPKAPAIPDNGNPQQ